MVPWTWKCQGLYPMMEENSYLLFVLVSFPNAHSWWLHGFWAWSSSYPFMFFNLYDTYHHRMPKTNPTSLAASQTMVVWLEAKADWKMQLKRKWCIWRKRPLVEKYWYQAKKSENNSTWWHFPVWKLVISPPNKINCLNMQLKSRFPYSNKSRPKLSREISHYFQLYAFSVMYVWLYCVFFIWFESLTKKLVYLKAILIFNGKWKSKEIHSS